MYVSHVYIISFIFFLCFWLLNTKKRAKIKTRGFIRDLGEAREAELLKTFHKIGKYGRQKFSRVGV